VKAVLCKQYGPPASLVVESVPSPQPGKGQVVVSVRACGVNFPDTLIIAGKYQYKPDLPFSPGSEMAGLVKQVGEGVSGVKPGDAVSAGTLWGAYAEEVVVNADRLAPLPEGMDFNVAAGITVTYGTTYYALKDRAHLKPGETLLVLGAAGGVGLAAVELGKLMGARVIAAASTDDKLATCKRFGADALINYNKDDLREAIKTLTGGKGVDVVYDPVGGHYSEAAVRGMAWGGRYLVVGFAAGEIPRIALNLTLLKGCAIVGVFWGEFAKREPQAHRTNMIEIYGWVIAGKLKPLVSATYPLARAADALADLLARKVHGKAILVV
jgi:NADPH2:quinone reductase